MTSPTQTPGNLPVGATLDSYLSVEQFAIWRMIPLRTAQGKVASGMPGVLRDAKRRVIHPRTYIAGQGKMFREAVTMREAV